MQGRLAEAPNNDDLDWFPAENWKEKFDLAKKVGFGSIELVFDRGCIRRILYAQNLAGPAS